MKTWQEFIEGRDDYKNTGVPHYARDDSMRPTYHGSLDPQFQAILLNMKKPDRKDYSSYVGKKFVFEPDSYYSKIHGNNQGTILKIGNLNVVYQMDGETKKRTLGKSSILYTMNFIDGPQLG